MQGICYHPQLPSVSALTLGCREMSCDKYHWSLMVIVFFVKCIHQTVLATQASCDSSWQPGNSINPKFDNKPTDKWEQSETYTSISYLYQFFLNQVPFIFVSCLKGLLRSTPWTHGTCCLWRPGLRAQKTGGWSWVWSISLVPNGWFSDQEDLKEWPICGSSVIPFFVIFDYTWPMFILFLQQRRIQMYSTTPKKIEIQKSDLSLF